MLQPHVTPDSFLHSVPGRKPSPPVIIYMISGNPGLIGYYHTFLSLLADKLASFSSEKKRTHRPFLIHGHSLAGFELSDQSDVDGGNQDEFYNLEEQICFVQRKLDAFLADVKSTPASSDTPSSDISSGADSTAVVKPKVILIGHSVGSYIAMEVIRRQRERKEKTNHVEFDVIGGAMLFPTVVDIASSDSGRKLTRLLSFIPQLALIAGLFVRALVACVSEPVLRMLIRLYMSTAPESVVETTAAFIKSRRGVRQALHMAADEMATITSDKWPDEVWGISEENSGLENQPARLFFYFGRNDHWVAERTRDEIIEARGRHPDGPRMVVCEEGCPHAFVLKHSEVMAGKVADMVMEIVGDST